MRMMMVAAGMAAAMAGSAAAQERTAFTTAERAMVEKELAMARVELDKTLFDYPTARFREVFVKGSPGETVIACGYVNAKNRMGAYIGWQRFAWFGSNKNRALYVSPTDVTMTDALCTEPGHIDSKDYAPDLTYRPR